MHRERDERGALGWGAWRQPVTRAVQPQYRPLAIAGWMASRGGHDLGPHLLWDVLGPQMWNPTALCRE